MVENYEPLQEEVMNLLSLTATLIDQDFAVYYSEFMPMMLEILTKVGMTTMQQKNLRSKTIEAMGFMIEAISDENQETNAQFKPNVLEITSNLI